MQKVENINESDFNGGAEGCEPYGIPLYRSYPVGRVNPSERDTQIYGQSLPKMGCISDRVSYSKVEFQKGSVSFVFAITINPVGRCIIRVCEIVVMNRLS